MNTTLITEISAYLTTEVQTKRIHSFSIETVNRIVTKGFQELEVFEMIEIRIKFEESSFWENCTYTFPGNHDMVSLFFSGIGGIIKQKQYEMGEN